jgi:phosphotransferase system HPr-like phosphotransfer protein
LGDFVVGQDNHAPPDRMPTIDQVIMWTGMAETARKGISYHNELLSKNGISIDEELNRGMLLDAPLALYPKRRDKTPTWEFLDDFESDKPTGVRTVANAVVLNAAASSGSTVLIKILNRRGLHARASAKLIAAYELWREELAARWEKPVLWIGRDGPGEEKMPLDSIMGLMMLSAGPGAMLVINFENCGMAEVETLLERLRCIKPTPSQNYWGATFGEED